MTKNTLEDQAYAGSLAKLIENAQFYKSKTLDEKFEMLKGWLSEFVLLNEAEFLFEEVERQTLIIKSKSSDDIVEFHKFNKVITDQPEKSIFSRG